MATAKTTTQSKTAQPRPQLWTPDQVTGYLVPAQTAFKTVTANDPSPLIWESELDFARSIIMNDKSERLRKATPDSLAACMRDLAHVGLTLNPVKHFCTIIGRWNDDLKVYEASITFMYRGLVYLATQAGVHDIQADVVYKADSFDIERRSDGDFFTHKINVTVPRDGQENFFLGSYVGARMPKTGERKVEWVPAEDIYRMRDQSDSYKDSQGKVRENSPWVKWFDEQAKKSGLKRAAKRWEEEVDEGSRWQRLHTAIDLDHKSEGGRTIEGTATEVPVEKLSVEQIAAIEAKAGELGQGDVNKYLRKICGAYGTETLADLPAKHYQEVLERIKASKAEVDRRRTAGK